VQRRCPTILTLLAVLVAVSASACSSGGGKKASEAQEVSTSSTTPATTPPVLPGFTVTARDYAFDFPSVVEGGVIRMTMDNTGKLKHEAVIVAAGDTPLDQVKQDLTPVVAGLGDPTPPYMRFNGGVSRVPGGTSEMAIITLPAGNYVMVCTLTDADSLQDKAGPPPDAAQKFHYELGMATPFTVKDVNNGTMPPTDGTVTARDWSFEIPTLVPGFKVLTFRNDGEQDHSLAVAEFPDGVDEAAAKAAFEKLLEAEEKQQALPDTLATPDDVAFAGPLSKGGQVTFPMNLKVHRTYVFACYMTDRSGGERHAIAKRMVAYGTTPNG
jgi:hypothetical protein